MLSGRRAARAAWAASLACLWLVGCQQSMEMPTAESDPLDAPPGCLSVYQLAGRLGLEVAGATDWLVTLSDELNCVRLFAGRPGRVTVNGQALSGPGRVVCVGETLFVATELCDRIRGRLKSQPAPRPRLRRRRPPETCDALVVIDPGHGGFQPGAIGVNGVREKTVNLAIARRTAKLLRGRVGRVRMTIDRDAAMGLNDRADLANRLRADLFVSIHANWWRSPSVRGFDVYVARAASARSLAAAAAIDRALRRAGAPPHGPQPKRHDLRVLVRTTGPAVLVETGFLSNPREARKLSDPRYQARIAAALADGIAAYLADG
jgi:N-acetylmuramoyl-L-alanine amidase